MKIDFRNLLVVGLGDGLSEKIKVAAYFAYLKICKILTGKDGLVAPKALKLIYGGKGFVFHVQWILDFHLLREMFVDEQYADARKIGPVPGTILDLGSNIGASVIYFKLIFPDSKIVAVEPNPECQDLLRRNLEQFGESVRIIAAAVSGDEGTVDFFPNKAHWSSSLQKRGGSGKPVSVRSTTLKNLCLDSGLSKIDLLKLDIEGAEYDMGEVFRSELDIGYILGELHPKVAGKDPREFFSLLPDGSEVLRDDPAGSHRHIFIRLSHHSRYEQEKRHFHHQ